jgi:hypothetical protein
LHSSVNASGDSKDNCCSLNIITSPKPDNSAIKVNNGRRGERKREEVGNNLISLQIFSSKYRDNTVTSIRSLGTIEKIRGHFIFLIIQNLFLFFNNMGKPLKEVIDSRIQMVMMLNAKALIPAIVSPMLR